MNPYTDQVTTLVEIGRVEMAATQAIALEKERHQRDEALADATEKLLDRLAETLGLRIDPGDLCTEQPDLPESILPREVLRSFLPAKAGELWKPHLRVDVNKGLSLYLFLAGSKLHGILYDGAADTYSRSHNIDDVTDLAKFFDQKRSAVPPTEPPATPEEDATRSRQRTLERLAATGSDYKYAGVLSARQVLATLVLAGLAANPRHADEPTFPYFETARRLADALLVDLYDHPFDSSVGPSAPIPTALEAAGL